MTTWDKLLEDIGDWRAIPVTIRRDIRAHLNRMALDHSVRYHELMIERLRGEHTDTDPTEVQRTSEAFIVLVKLLEKLNE